MSDRCGDSAADMRRPDTSLHIVCQSVNVMNVVEIVREHAERDPSRVALIDTYRGRPRQTTYGEFEQAAGRTATLLSEMGLRSGDLVLVFHPMSNELYIALGALLRLGLVAMFIDPSAGRRHIDRCCELPRPHRLIASGKAHCLRLISRELRQIPCKLSIGAGVPGAVAIKSGPQMPL